jgi:hypothetical protein
LQSGNLSAAQQAFTQLTQDAQSASGSHHHHAEGSGSSAGTQLIEALASQSTSAAGSTTAASSTTGSASTGLNVSA